MPPVIGFVCLIVISIVVILGSTLWLPTKVRASRQLIHQNSTDRVKDPTRILMYPECYAGIYQRIYPDNDVQYVASGPADGLIFINTEIPPPYLVQQVPEGQIVGMAAEPLEFTTFSDDALRFIQTKVKSYLIGSQPAVPGPWWIHYGYMVYATPALRPVWSEKQHVMSIIVGDRIFLPGHKYRHLLAEEIVKRKLPVHIWGKGAAQYKDSHPWTKGEFEHLEPFEDYQFTIAVENNTSTAYISEKYTNAISCNTIPLYYGATDVQEYFGDNWGLRLYGSLDYDIRMIEQVLQNPHQYQMDLDAAHNELMKGKAAFAPFVKKLFGKNV